MEKIGWRSPSNIALVKYWGKYGAQMPANPSISFTLSTSVSETFLHWQPKAGSKNNVEVFLDGQPAPHFAPKILDFFNRVRGYLPFYDDYDFRIETHNTFPHSSGIASSASGLSALALCSISLKKVLGYNVENFWQEASILSRLGSGSASRSVFGPLAVWGAHADTPGSHQEFAVPYNDVHSDFLTYQDYILLVDVGTKAVSSTAGHNLMNNHAFAAQRFEQAHKNLTEIQGYLRSGDHESFGQLVESEALTLHAMMMTSRPYYMLFKPNTIAIIEEIWAFRKDTNTPLYFTLDAGANVHLLFPASAKQIVDAFVVQSLSRYCANGAYLCDHVGHGPTQLL